MNVGVDRDSGGLRCQMGAQLSAAFQSLRLDGVLS